MKRELAARPDVGAVETLCYIYRVYMEWFYLIAASLIDAISPEGAVVLGHPVAFLGYDIPLLNPKLYSKYIAANPSVLCGKFQPCSAFISKYYGITNFTE